MFKLDKFVIIKILDQLKIFELTSVRLTCKQLNLILDRDCFWKLKLVQYYPQYEHTGQGDFKKRFMRLKKGHAKYFKFIGDEKIFQIGRRYRYVCLTDYTFKKFQDKFLEQSDVAVGDIITIENAFCPKTRTHRKHSYIYDGKSLIFCKDDIIPKGFKIITEYPIKYWTRFKYYFPKKLLDKKILDTEEKQSILEPCSHRDGSYTGTIFTEVIRKFYHIQYKDIKYYILCGKEKDKFDIKEIFTSKDIIIFPGTFGVDYLIWLII